MHVLMRIDVSGIATDKFAKHSELTNYFALYSSIIVQRDYLIKRHPVVLAKVPLSQIEMQPYAQSRMGSTQLDRFGGEIVAHHQTSAGYYTVAMSLNNTAIDSSTLAKVIRSDNE
jgi:hypothetical protein